MLALSLLLFSLAGILLWIAFSSELENLLALGQSREPEPFDQFDLAHADTLTDQWTDLSDLESDDEDPHARPLVHA